MVVVTIPMDYRLGRQKLVNTKKQLDMPMQQNNPKIEVVRLQHGKSHQLSHQGGACFCDAEVQKGVSLADKTSKEAKKHWNEHVCYESEQ